MSNKPKRSANNKRELVYICGCATVCLGASLNEKLILYFRYELSRLPLESPLQLEWIQVRPQIAPLLDRHWNGLFVNVRSYRAQITVCQSFVLVLFASFITFLCQLYKFNQLFIWLFVSLKSFTFVFIWAYWVIFFFRLCFLVVFVYRFIRPFLS